MNLPDAVCEGFGLRAPRITPVIEGHINESWRVTTAKRDLIVQRINGFVFSNPSVMIANADRAARALRTYWNDPGLEFIETRDGQLALRDAEGNYWRAARYVDHIEVTAHGDPEIAFRAAEAFGRVLTGLATLDVDTWENPIPGFHDLAPRLTSLDSLVQTDPKGRLSEVGDEVDWVAAHSVRLTWPTEIPRRLIHGDCKLSNVLFDARREVVAVVDLDTVMVGYSGWDFGDLVRSAASSAPEDESDTARVGLDMEVFEALASGYKKATADLLSAPEVESLTLGVPYITFMLGVRFLADYLDGDRYFRIRHALQNLHRARAQLSLAGVMLERLDEMREVLSRTVG